MCEHVDLGNGNFAIVCGVRGRKRKLCVVCGKQTAERECDWKVGNGKTCDRALCSSCTFSPAPKKDLCPEHRQAYEQWKQCRALPLFDGAAGQGAQP